MGGEPRKITDVAIDCALHQLPEPTNGWRNHIPPEDLGAMVSSGSGQITLQACVAALLYGNRPQAIRTLENYAALCPTRFMLSEPWSLIYGKAIVCNWLAVILIADRIGERALARKFRGLVETWAGTCALMESHGKVMAAGCRCWGHEVHGGGWDDLWAFACRRDNPPAPSSRKYGTPGASDDWGWLNRCAALAIGELRSAAAPFLGRDWRSLLAGIPRWGARTEMQLLGWADGSRLWIMGDDETAEDDEDPNSNTPGFLIAGYLGGKVTFIPRWPTKTLNAAGKLVDCQHLRQVNCRADVDGNPTVGWTVLHSHLGDEKSSDGRLLSRLAPYTASPLVFWQHCPAGSLSWVDRLASEPTGPIPIPPVSPVPTPAPKPPKRRKPWWRFW